MKSTTAKLADWPARPSKKPVGGEHLAAHGNPRVLHSDNSSPMKAATFLEKLHNLGMTPSKSLPRVSNDNGFSEALFRTLKFLTSFPVNGFATSEQACVGANLRALVQPRTPQKRAALCHAGAPLYGRGQTGSVREEMVVPAA